MLAPTSQETLDRAIFEGHSVEAQDTRRSRVKEKTPAIERQDEMDIDVRVEIEKVTSVVERAISPEPEKELMQMPERHARQEQEREATPVIIFPAKQVDAPSMFPPELQPLARLQKRTVTPSRRLHREISYGAPSGELLERLSASSSHSFSSQRGPTAKGIVEDSLIETVQYRLNHPQIDPLTGEFLNPAAILYTRTTPPLVVTPPETDEDTDDQPVERRRIAKPSEQVSYTSIETDVLLPHASHPDIRSRLLNANINRKIRQDVEEVDEAAQAFRAKYAEIGVMLPEKEHRPWPTFEDYDFDDDRPPMLKRAVSAQRSEETDEEDTSDEEEDVDAGAAVLAQTIAEELHDMSGRCALSIPRNVDLTQTVA